VRSGTNVSLKHDKSLEQPGTLLVTGTLHGPDQGKQLTDLRELAALQGILLLSHIIERRVTTSRPVSEACDTALRDKPYPVEKRQPTVWRPLSEYLSVVAQEHHEDIMRVVRQVLTAVDISPRNAPHGFSRAKHHHRHEQFDEPTRSRAIASQRLPHQFSMVPMTVSHFHGRVTCPCGCHL
jgi:hypothetical protein